VHVNALHHLTNMFSMQETIKRQGSQCLG